MRIMAAVWKGPGHVSRVRKPAAIEGVLDTPDALNILVLEEVLPSFA